MQNRVAASPRSAAIDKAHIVLIGRALSRNYGRAMKAATPPIWKARRTS
jgi:hypothetical protein